VRLHRPPVGVLRPILGIYLLTCVSLLYYSALSLPTLPIGLYPLSRTLWLEMTILVLGLLLIVLSRLESLNIWGVFLSLGLISTLTSIIHIASNSPPPDICGDVFNNYGFPFPWYGVIKFQLTTTGALCLLPSPVSPRVDSLAFILDTIFYAGAYFAALELLRGISLVWQKGFFGSKLQASSEAHS
jgi:hypothetical protein